MLLPEVVIALVVVSIVGSLESSSKVKSDLDKDVQKGDQALDTRIDALLHTTLEMSDKMPPVSEEEVDEELARMSGFTARAAPSSAHSECSDLEMQTKLSECSDMSGLHLPGYDVALEVYREQSFTSNESTSESSLGSVCSTVLSLNTDWWNVAVYCSEDSDSEPFMPESTLLAAQVYREQSYTSNESTSESSLESVCTTVLSLNQDLWDVAVYCSEDSDSEPFMPESTLLAVQVYREQSSRSTESTLESSPGREWSSVGSYDPDPENK